MDVQYLTGAACYKGKALCTSITGFLLRLKRQDD